MSTLNLMCLRFVIVVFPDHTHLPFFSSFFERDKHSGEPDQTPQNMTSDKGLHCLHKLYSIENNQQSSNPKIENALILFNIYVCCFDSLHTNKQFFVHVGLKLSRLFKDTTQCFW